MNNSLDLHEITTVVAVALADSENGSDERGWWPVLALTDEAHPIVFECNLNETCRRPEHTLTYLRC